jgi:signal recognition particle GTPase
VQEVNQLLKQFEQMRQMFSQISKISKKPPRGGPLARMGFKR